MHEDRTSDMDLDEIEPESGRILLRQYIKMYFLNKEDKNKYNIKFFAEQFNIFPETLQQL